MKICPLVIISVLYFAQAQSEFSSTKLGATACDHYLCKTSDQSFVKGQCGLRTLNDNDGSYNMYAYPACSSDEACVLSNEPTVYTCTTFEPVTGYKWPGEKCDNSDMCNSVYSNGCKDGRCLGSESGAPCIDHNSCLPGLYCQGYNSTDKGTCQKQISENNYDCSEDYDCVNYAWCNITNVVTKNLCFSFGSFQPHSFVSTCNGNQNYLCSSGYCFTHSESERYQCSENLTSAEPTQLPNTCDGVGELCQSVPDKYFSDNAYATQPCACAYNEAGSLYCPLFNGDAPALRYYAQLQKWLTSKESEKCNTMRRVSLTCIKDFWDGDNYDKLVYYQNYLDLYPMINGAVDCVLKTFLPDYYQARKAYNNDAAEILIVTAFIASLF